ncbi:MAG TPA: TonB-dependent receptor [Chitinophagaceae bacterium]|nr:TonB-dependent receptor [Chitinophagaceae bacterium]
MKIVFKSIVFFLFPYIAISQESLRIKVADADEKNPLTGATVVLKPLYKSVVADSAGIALFTGLAAGSYSVEVSFVGYETKVITVTVPAAETVEVMLEHEGEEEEEVIVQSTRTSRSIRNVPTRVETITLEEIDEKSNMRPANISMLLHESTGIQVQQTSATSANASIRIQGLDGRYTQLLKDGFANFGNFASGLSVLEIPPLDLKQVEIIKGPASTLYGGGAIAGMVNFISKTPGSRPVHEILLNQSNIGQSNIGYFSSGRNKKMGYTFLGTYNYQQLFDVDKDDFTEVPRSSEFILHPKVFWYWGENNTLVLGNSFTKGVRKGGDVQVIKGNAGGIHQYFEENNTVRNITTAEFTSKKESRELQVKQSFSVFDRHIEIPGYHFDGVSYNSFTDASLLIKGEQHTIVTGANFIYDRFNEKAQSAANRDNTQAAAGLYAQDTWDASDKIKLETGLRVDYAGNKNNLYKRYEAFVLPRVSLLINYTDHLSSRIGGGLGYKLPTLFTERTENFQYRNINQLDDVKAERSYGATADINFRKEIAEELDFSFNQMFFYTRINRPLVLEEDGGMLSFVNAARPVNSRGFETNARFVYHHDFKLFLGYTYTDAQARYLAGNQFLPLVPKHKFNSALIYEKHGFLKAGLEGYYTSSQYLFNGMQTNDFWEFGFMVEKIFNKFSVYINFENFTDTRQSRFKNVVNGTHDQPDFDDIWTHTEGFVINGGVKIRL